jgi:LacI family transcriptional regulator
MTTIKDVAKKAGVSTATVSRVLNGDSRVTPPFRKAVLEAVEALNYQRDRTARRLRAKVSQTIGLIISDIQNPFFTSVARGVEDEAYNNGYNLLLCTSDEDLQKERLYLDIMLAESAAGVIISPGSEQENTIEPILKAGVPVVVVDRRVEGAAVDTVMVDNFESTRQAVGHLLDLGHRRIGFVGGPPQVTTARERRAGYERAYCDRGIELDPDLIKASNFKLTGGYTATCELLENDDPPTALFTANCLTTLGALNRIHERGLAIPQEIAIVGFDDMPWATSLNPPLSVVAQPTYELGRKTAQLLFRRIKDRNCDVMEVRLKPRFIVRDSC